MSAPYIYDAARIVYVRAGLRGSIILKERIPRRERCRK
jgi:hypothetical protein